MPQVISGSRLHPGSIKRLPCRALGLFILSGRSHRLILESDVYQYSKYMHAKAKGAHQGDVNNRGVVFQTSKLKRKIRRN